MPPQEFRFDRRFDNSVKAKKYCIAVMGTVNDYWFNSKLLTEEYNSMEEAEENRVLTRDLLKLKDENLLILAYNSDQKWVKQCILKG